MEIYGLTGEDLDQSSELLPKEVMPHDATVFVEVSGKKAKKAMEELKLDTVPWAFEVGYRAGIQADEE